MILIGFSISKIVVGVLCVTLSILLLIIAYRKLLAYLGRGNLSKENYCELHRLEKNPVSGQIEFYFTSHEAKFIRLEILNTNYELIQELVAKDFEAGPHIIYFDSTSIPNGTYHYQLRTENQKTIKKMEVDNLVS